jgi:hypothetical protein
MLMVIVNFVFSVLFWNMCTIAADEGRPNWAFTYLILSAANGAAALATIF